MTEQEESSRKYRDRGHSWRRVHRNLKVVSVKEYIVQRKVDSV